MIDPNNNHSCGDGFIDVCVTAFHITPTLTLHALESEVLHHL
jgi:hypothetical protein